MIDWEGKTVKNHPGDVRRGMFGIVTLEGAVLSEYQDGEFGDALSYHDDHFGRNDKHRNWRWTPSDGLKFPMGCSVDEEEYDSTLRHIGKRLGCTLNRYGFIEVGEDDT